MQIRTLAVAAALSFVSAGAFAQDVKVDFDKAADFTKYKTFAIKLGTSWNNPLGEKRVLAEIQQGLTELMMEATDPVASDELAQAIRKRYLSMRKTTIYAGSNEIQRNIIAKSTLGL